MRVIGTAPVEEALSAGSALGRRLYGWRRFSFFIYLAVLAAQAAAWMSLPDTMGLNLGFAALGCLATTVAIVSGYVRWCRSLGRKGWRRLGALAEVELCFDFGDAGFEIVSSSGTNTSVPWSAVLSLEREQTLWLFIMKGGSALYLPRRFLADPTQEKAFVALCLAKISPEARARSGEAAAFARKP